MAEARRARQDRRYAAAASLFDEASRLLPWRTSLHLQAGHMAKEAGDLATAERHYQAVLRDQPDDADTALQMGHFHKTAGRYDAAHEWYARALTLRPGDAEATRERAWIDALTAPVEGAGLIPALVPRGATEKPLTPDSLTIARFGQEEMGQWGWRRTLRGVIAVRGYAVSAVPARDVRLLIDGAVLHREPVARGVQRTTTDGAIAWKQSFNAWVDVSGLAPGLHAAEVRVTDERDGVLIFRDVVVIAPPVTEADWPDSDAVVTLMPGDTRSIEAQVRARPSMIRPADRQFFRDGLSSILVLRTDQLGDVVASIPALRRLRAIAPHARIVGLLTAANIDLARTLGLFDELIEIDFPDLWEERRRVMPLEAQAALRARLAPYRFDLALDLATSHASRDLLRLSGARMTFGMGGGDWLDGSVALDVRDPWSGRDRAPHAARVLGLVEALGALTAETSPTIRRDDLPREALAVCGLSPDDRYAVLHTGARIPFSRWTGFAALAERLLAETTLHVVLVAEDDAASAVSSTLSAHPRFHLIDRRLTFDQFDAVISYAAVVVGNDSGPKHLAALRGVPVVTLFTARIDWREWGQEKIGTIISRRVPCAGCAIFHDEDECGKDFACIRDVRVDEVAEAVMRALLSP